MKIIFDDIEDSEDSPEVLLRKIRRILNTPEGMSILDHAKNISHVLNEQVQALKNLNFLSEEVEPVEPRRERHGTRKR